MVVQCLSVLRQNGRKGNHTSVRGSNAIEHTGYILLFYAGFAKAHGRSMHLISYVAGTFYFFNFACFFYRPQIYYCFDECQRAVLFQLGHTDTEQIFQAEHGIMTVRRKEMDGTVLFLCFLYQFFQLGIRSAVAYANLCGKLFHAGLRPHPDNVVHRNVISEEILFSTLGVDSSGYSRLVNSEEIKECTVLTELIGVVGIITRCFVVSQ